MTREELNINIEIRKREVTRNEKEIESLRAQLAELDKKGDLE